MSSSAKKSPRGLPGGHTARRRRTIKTQSENCTEKLRYKALCSLERSMVRQIPEAGNVADERNSLKASSGSLIRMYT
jgi:hypothetical protein